MKTKTINLYEFKELSQEAKKYAIDKYYENENYLKKAYIIKSKTCLTLVMENKKNRQTDFKFNLN